MHFIRLVVVCLFLVACSGDTQTYQPLNDVAVVKASTDKREYRYIELPNQLKVLLIEDLSADKAAAAMDVFVGAYQQPKDQQGLAHFLEHMLFLGTEKYPQPDEYQTFISQHGGQHNAYTSSRHTNYFFDISPEFFDEGLDRFAQFFIAPLFNEDYVHREKQAVHSEYLARIKNDGRKQMEALGQVLNQQHPSSQFSVGSLDTLKDTEQQSLQDSLLAFYQQYYSASNMALVVIAPESLDSLEQKVSQIFTPIKQFDVKKPEIDQPLFADNLPLLLEIQPEELSRELSFLFPVPDDHAFYRTKPTSYISNLIGHEGKGSLLASLKSCGWAESLSAGAGFGDGKNAALQVSISLTPEGLEHWQQVSRQLFEYIDLLNAKGVAQWRFEEQGRLAQMHFDFKGNSKPIHTVSRLASSLHDYPAKEVLAGPYVMDQYLDTLIAEYSNSLSADNLLLVKVHPDVVAAQHSPFYNTAYSTQALDVKELLNAEKDSCVLPLALPDSNPYIPEQFEVIGEANKTDKPIQISLDSAPWVEAWFSGGSQFNTPKTQLFAKLNSPDINSVEEAALLRLYLAVVRDNLNQETYPAMLAGLNYSLNAVAQGVELRVTGFSDKLPLLSRRVLQSLLNPELESETVLRLKNTLLKGWKNSLKQEPYKQLMAAVPPKVLANTYSPADLAQALESKKVGDLVAFSQGFNSSPLALQLFVHGNVNVQQAEAISNDISDLFSTKYLLKFNTMSVKQFASYDQQTLHIDHNDSAVVRYYQALDQSYKSHAEILLLQQIIKAPFFDQLRTEQQLGYIVAALNLTMDKLPGLGLLVQSPSVSEVEINNAIDAFLKDFEQQLIDLDDQQFSQYKKAVVNNLAEKPTNIDQQAQRYWSSIQMDYLSFDSREKVIEAVKALSHDQIVDAFQARMQYDSRGFTVTTQ